MEVITFRGSNVADCACFYDRFRRFLRDTVVLILTFDEVHNQEVLIFKLTGLSYMGRHTLWPYYHLFSFSRHDRYRRYQSEEQRYEFSSRVVK